LGTKSTELGSKKSEMKDNPARQPDASSLQSSQREGGFSKPDVTSGDGQISAKSTRNGAAGSKA